MHQPQTAVLGTQLRKVGIRWLDWAWYTCPSLPRRPKWQRSIFARDLVCKLIPAVWSCVLVFNIKSLELTPTALFHILQCCIRYSWIWTWRFWVLVWDLNRRKWLHLILLRLLVVIIPLRWHGTVGDRAARSKLVNRGTRAASKRFR